MTSTRYGNEARGMNNEELRLFLFLIHQFTSRTSFTVCEFGSFFGMPASLKHEEDGGTETRRLFKIAEQGIGSDPKLQSPRYARQLPRILI